MGTDPDPNILGSDILDLCPDFELNGLKFEPVPYLYGFGPCDVDIGILPSQV